MKTELAKARCKPCADHAQALKGDKLRKLATKLDHGWKVIKEHHIEKRYRFKNFIQALRFTNRVGRIAEKEGHHPDIYLAWGEVRLQVWTHNVDGLTENDFILAAKADGVT